MNRTPTTHQEMLDAVDLFKKYAKHTLIAASTYAILVLITLILDYFAHMMKDSPFHYRVLVALERFIFVTGSILLLLVVLCITFVFIYDLLKNFRKLFP